MKDQDFLARLELMTLEEKLSLLGETDKAYICGYIDRALFEQQRTKSLAKEVHSEGPQ